MAINIQVEDKYVMVNGLQLHYRAWGAASKPPLLILHGLTGHAWEFDSVASTLSKRFYVLAINQRGHGASAWAEEYSPEIMADDIAAFIDALKLDHVTIIGHSMGGVNSWWFAAHYPEKLEQLVIIDVTPEVITANEVTEYWMTALDAYAQTQYTDPEEAVAEYLSGYSGAHHQALRTFVINNLVENSESRWSWRFDGRGLKGWMEHASANEEAHWSVLQHLACPTLIIGAANNPLTDVSDMERMVQAIPQAQLVEIPDTGHDIHIDQHNALMAVLQTFLRAM